MTNDPSRRNATNDEDITANEAEVNNSSLNGNGASLNGSGGVHADDCHEIRVDEIDAVDDTAPSLSEQWVAKEFAQRHVDDLRYVATWKKWVWWDGSRWVDDETQAAFNMAIAICREYSRVADKRALTVASNGFAQSVLKLASADPCLAATVDAWDLDPWLLNTPEGVVDLKTGTLRNARPGDMMRMMTAVGPKVTRNDGENCPLWTDFLNQTFKNNKLMVEYIQRVLGYCLTGSTEEEQMWFGYGSGNNGKGVLLRVLRALLGNYVINVAIETFTINQNERHPEELARLQGKRLVTSSETEEGRRWAESRIKEIVGRGEITARHMRENSFDFIPQFKLFLTGNHMPVLRNVGLAMARRFNRIPFTVNIPQSKVNKDLVDELVAKEGPGIMLWLIEGCVKWKRDGLLPPDEVTKSSESYLSGQDVLGEWMRDCCEADAKGWVSSTDLFGSWKVWAEGRQEFVGSVSAFSRKLEDRGEWTKGTGGPKKNRSGFSRVKLKDAKTAEEMQEEIRRAANLPF